MSFEEQVRERAYHIWLAGGMADGQAENHWVRAEQALRGETTSAEPVVIITKAAAKPRKAAANTAKTKVTKVAAKPALRAKVNKTGAAPAATH